MFEVQPPVQKWKKQISILITYLWKKGIDLFIDLSCRKQLINDFLVEVLMKSYKLELILAFEWEFTCSITAKGHFRMLLFLNWLRT